MVVVYNDIVPCNQCFKAQVKVASIQHDRLCKESMEKGLL